MSITSITIAITSITCITASILQQCPSLPSPSPSRLSHALQLQSYNKVHHHCHNVYHIHYSFNPITMSITIAITSITSITASVLEQCPSSSPSRLSQVLQFRSKNSVHHHRHHFYHMHVIFNPIRMSITSITIAITSITWNRASIQ